MISRDDYFKDPKTGERRDKRYVADMTPMIEENAEVTVAKANLLLTRYRESTGDDQPRKVNSGWRPPAVNAGTQGASPTSRHMTGEAIDIGDGDAALDAWLMTEVGTAVLVDLGLWHEHPRDTIGWAHCQTVPPRSGNRHFFAK